MIGMCGDPLGALPCVQLKEPADVDDAAASAR